MLTLSGSVVSTDTDYGTALLDQRSGRYWTLNPTATLILRVLLDGGDPPRAARVLLDRFDVAPETARADVDLLVDQLRSAGLVTGSVPGAEPATSQGTAPRPGRRASTPRGVRLPFRQRPAEAPRGRHSRRNAGPRVGQHRDDQLPIDQRDDRYEGGR
ncbi:MULTISPECIES: lasso peptide biosynthesis PqqD family chaperone [unclassified Pseudofrankia]|uniref:lasso peptide biosynthesis PqqD family chaperone n=1 Tax=unclassified Pseudofrankia TaxID=2994372 RepID=UPI0009F1C468|nr:MULTISPECIES: lasso peptide biosynthesis PqqD family chaperone [unclassified Pseudofrankia]MDT3443618.1 lasso peptide biosynthesis PqqD family chaperone [Pseudofrankia sp. BMG5.37]